MMINNLFSKSIVEVFFFAYNWKTLFKLKRVHIQLFRHHFIYFCSECCSCNAYFSIIKILKSNLIRMHKETEKWQGLLQNSAHKVKIHLTSFKMFTNIFIILAK